jgi:hypothetical protein
LQEKKHITASCRISRRVVYKNNKLFYTGTQDHLSDFLEGIYLVLNMQYPKFYKMDRLSRLGLVAAEVLMKGSFRQEKYQSDEIAIVLANANSSLDTDIRYQETIKTIPSPSLFVYTLPNIVIGEICIRHGIKGENAFFVFKQFDATFMEHYVSNLLDNHLARACICGWVELLREEYKAVLMLVEREQSGRTLLFTKKNIIKTGEFDHG